MSHERFPVAAAFVAMGLARAAEAHLARAVVSAWGLRTALGGSLRSMVAQPPFGRLALHRLYARLSDHAPNGVEQRLGKARLRQECAAAGILRPLSLGVERARRQHDNRRRSRAIVGAELLHQFDPVGAATEQNTGDDDVNITRACQRVSRGRDGHAWHALRLEVLEVHLKVVVVLLDEKDGRRIAAGIHRVPRASRRDQSKPLLSVALRARRRPVSAHNVGAALPGTAV